ncbi:MAG TPA: dimethylsulfoniopropionate demethylase [Gammaproteobacteria bacterium]|jgi:dimethylsulfoniopropionate demethylase|nr:dimethylsulfoniopropionate demethylase [Acidiferrobacteraceae bacterium]MDP6397786.1 dimethylsulfoniopropionate demethylase [Arenicellales bacterium]HCX88103.1 dimethylsulfoniopropionate demethylase [Gammaproteobacteria bacterium]MDP6552023.1 dimethylsulfoniopropionate demethylase [Arenicellales bacterium]MDP6791897.1 dimethylsulfoniopropionate demethylase [Arenicellales bacterium]|tara:strand:- start:13549 stop:14670 length:1122 start_codon:yes stop_codon:yes gene_type:complete
MPSGLVTSRRNRRTPYTDRVEALGVSGFSIVNHTLLPKSFARSVEADYWHLKEHVQLWDVGCQRQVELRGPDAARLAQKMTPRDLRAMTAGQCYYTPIIDNSAGLLNDPVLLKRAPDWFWFSIADSDVLLWAKALALGMNLDLQVSEPDVWPLAVQGPRAEDLVASVFGDEVRSVRYFSFMECGFHGRQLVVARSGYSKQGGFEIYLDDSALGSTLWDTLWEAGADLQVAPGCPNLIERIEAGLLSYGNEMTRENNPLEINLDRFCHLQGEIDYIGRPALEAIAAQGPSQRMRGLLIDGDPCPTCGKPWPIIAGDTQVGQVTSAIWSPAFRKNVGLSLIRKDHWNPGTPVTVALPGGLKSDGVVASLPFENPG